VGKGEQRDFVKPHGRVAGSCWIRDGCQVPDAAILDHRTWALMRDPGDRFPSRDLPLR
jgi:hypothetical protein